ncbi:hypothetical protein Acj9p081 [Acinetobacter phage Acj9]|uniref:Conserved hypothetical phage protein n=1 Tax=Acinetobacter phage Acj9 TaxID=760939 RepID=E5EPL5_9CAUD|nr:hypothetical protein Acj9p081 [Acinetobacter phage Acj9]ADG59981.1 conserved hypothetical phage protein [Acinetobacter phage Acj9]
MDLITGPKIAFCPSKWAPGKKWLEKSWLTIDASRQMIQAELLTAKVMVNTCHNTGTVENGSLEAISKGVPVLQLVQKGYSHATFEYDPETVCVEFEEGEDVKSLTSRYAKALQNFEDTYEKRIERANKLYLKYNPTMYFAQWATALS